MPLLNKAAKSGSTPSYGSAIGVYPRIPEEKIRAWIADFTPRLVQWFAENPRRKICKVDWFYGRSIDLRRESFEIRIAAEMTRLLSKPNAEISLAGRATK